ncbi:MAG TPA: hypothetical protein VF155_01960, partial [Candidatus Dormibacteraeota bacterium]
PDPMAILDEAENVLHRWVDVAADTMRASEAAGVDAVAAALADVFSEPPDVLSSENLEKFEVLNGVHSNAAGIVRYLQRRAGSPAHQEAPPSPA